MKLFEYMDDQILSHHTYNDDTETLRFYLHAHKMMELYYFISGNVEYIVEGTTYHLSSGDMILTRSAELHKPIIYPGAPYERISIQFSPDLISDIDKSGLLLRPFMERSLGTKNLYSSHNLCDGGLAFFFDGLDLPKTSEEKRLSIISVLLSALLAISREFEDISYEEKYPNINSVTSQMINYINQELFSKISVSSISRHFFLSESQANRIFKKATGSSIWEYIRIKRLLAARELILSGTSAAQAAASCGFQDYSVFYRAYMDKFKVSPSKTGMRNEGAVNID